MSGSWKEISDSLTLAAGTYIAVGVCAKAVTYLRISKHDDVETSLLNYPYGNLIIGQVTVPSGGIRVRLWAYSATSLTVGVREAKMFLVKIA